MQIRMVYINEIDFSAEGCLMGASYPAYVSEEKGWGGFV